MSPMLRRFISDESGATAIEYGLIATLIALVIIGGLSAVSSANNDKYNAISSAINRAM